jgi:predicted XRE-type DNA-binding protein
LSNPEERLAKAELAAAVSRAIRQLDLTQVEVARKLGIDQPRVSALMNGHLALFSTDALLQYLTALGRDVNISIGNGHRNRAGKVRVACSA